MPAELEEKTYVKCEVTQGMFLFEYFIRLKDFYGNTMWGFADKKSIKIQKEPQTSEVLDGLARVSIIEEHKNKYLIQLPTEQCDRIYVNADKLEIFI